MKLPPPSWLEIEAQGPHFQYVDENGQILTKLSGLGRVNILVGPNNGGKSRLLRSIAGQKSYGLALNVANLDDLSACVREQSAFLKANWRDVPKKIGAVGPDFLDKLNVPKVLLTNSDALAPVGAAVTSLRAIKGKPQTGGFAGLPRLSKVLEQVATTIEQKVASIAAIDLAYLNPKHKIYIPTLRGLRTLGQTDQDHYEARTKSDYFPTDAQDAPRIFTGLRLYEEVRNQLLGHRGERNSIRRYEEFLATQIFNVAQVSLIPRRDANVLVIKIGREPERAIHDLGDGIQSVVVMTYLLFSLRDAWFFIEEPELFLHPGLQRKILELLLQHDGNQRTFLTSHSNHFLDMSLDYEGVAIYGVSKINEKTGKDEEVQPSFGVELFDDANQTALSLLGVRASSVFLVNATVWVEGITDRFYLRRMLELHQAQLGEGEWQANEDQHFSFVEYGGANVVHYAFAEGSEERPINVERLCGRAIVIVDLDANTKQSRLEAMEKVLHDRLIKLPVREVENLLPWNVLSKVIADYEGIDATSLHVVAETEYRDKYLGRFIEEEILKGKSTRKGGYAAESGTLCQKRAFCEKALGHLDAHAYAALSDDCKAVIENVYRFIKVQNHQ